MSETDPGPASLEGTQNVTDLSPWFDTSRYLVPTSDLVALLVLEHQTRMTNLLIRIGWDARIAQHDGALVTQGAQLNAEIDELVAYMLFGDEAPLRQPVAGVSGFSKTFQQHYGRPFTPGTRIVISSQTSRYFSNSSKFMPPSSSPLGPTL